MVHIAGKRFSPRGEEARQVKVYTNCDGVYLIHDGVRYYPDGNPQAHVYTWDNIPWKEGDNRFTAHALRDGRTIYDNCVITYKK